MYNDNVVVYDGMMIMFKQVQILFYVQSSYLNLVILLIKHVIEVIILQKYILLNRNIFNMDQFFISQDPPVPSQQYQPPQQPYSAFDFVQSNHVEQINATSSTLAYNNYQSSRFQSSGQVGQGGDNDFNDFEQDEITRRVRADQQRIQRILKDKSQRQWQQKSKRKQEGRRQLEQFQTKMFQNKQTRAQQNLRKQEIIREENNKLNVEAGWKKVITNINIRQGQHKGTKDINRMREAILHIRQDKGK